MSGLRDRVDELCARAAEMLAGTPHAPRVDDARARLDRPLRVAIAGKVKAGKSTLLNALVGERLAPTDAGECTRLVSWYREGLGYEVHAVLPSGERQPLAFSREDGALDVDLGALTLDDVDHLDVRWPSSALRHVTLIDTPGLASATPGTSLRTIDFLSPEDSPGEADAVLYLMRHLHRHDADFLETFTDRSLSNASPVNAIAVLSRADELGGARPDALDTAERIAARYREDPRVRALASTVVPVAGLVAETGLTLREEEFGWLRQLAGEPSVERAELLLSVDRFVEPERGPLLPELRERLLERLGLYGARMAIGAIADGEATSGPELARLLVDLSGLPRLRELLEGHFLARAEALKARSVLSALRALAGSVNTDAAPALTRAVEEVEAASHELAELRLVHLVLAGATRLGDDDEAEVLRLTRAAPAHERLGLEPEADEEALRAAALAGAERWRTRRANPMTDPVTAEACDIVARGYEGLYARATHRA